VWLLRLELARHRFSSGFRDICYAFSKIVEQKLPFHQVLSGFIGFQDRLAYFEKITSAALVIGMGI